MQTTLKFIGLSVGMLLIFLSFLFFGRRQDTYEILLNIGLVIACVSYLLILFGKEELKRKLLWTAVVILCAVIQQMTEPFFIKTSYRIFINQNENSLTEINNILDHTNGDVIIISDSIVHEFDQFTPEQIEKLIKGRKKLGVYIISKTDHETYYGFSGFLDVRLGITYWAEKSYPDIRYRHITGSWFH
jgi:hypothetical protein